MSDGDDGKWVIPALVAILLVGASSIGLSRPDDPRSPEVVIDEARSWFERTVGGFFPREALNPCGSAPRPVGCSSNKEVRKSCLLAIKAGGERLRRLVMTKPAADDVRAELSLRVDDDVRAEALEWKASPGGRARATADVGPQAGSLKISCGGSCVVTFE